MVKDILFNEKEHKYYDELNRTYTSVTTLIGQYTNTFDGDFWSMYTALKNHGFRVKPEPEKQKIYIGSVAYKLTDLKKDPLYILWQEEVNIAWRITNKLACDRGNETHNELEDNINKSKGDLKGLTNDQIINFSQTTSSPTKGKLPINTIHDLNKTNLEEKYPIVYNRLKGYIDRGCSIFAEKKVFLEEYLLAGMIDCPIIKDNKFIILDWKTNKDELHDTPGYYQKINVGGKWIKSRKWISTEDCFKYPLDNLLASKQNIYALQLSTYAYILEKYGFILIEGGLEIIHFPLGEEPRLIKMPYLKKEVEIMLNHHKHSKVA
jgi:hypothetical protein